jgi:hypothetical protein
MVVTLTVFLGPPVVGQRNEPTTSPPHDLELNRDLAKTFVSEVEQGEYDLLESQYRGFQKETQPDGTPKIWVYFDSFFQESSTETEFEEATAFTQKLRKWLNERPNSVPALLALVEALLGECQCMRRGCSCLREAHFDQPARIEQVQESADEMLSRIRTFPDSDSLLSEPQYYVTSVQMFPFGDTGYDQFLLLEDDLEQIDEYYLPFYARAIDWIAFERHKDPSVPRPEIWLADHLKPTFLDSDKVRIKKCSTYAQVVSFAGRMATILDLKLLDWPTLRSGLQSLIEVYGPNTDWPSRYLVYAYRFGDREAAWDALKIIRGNYSPEIFTDPTAYQELEKWAKGESSHHSNR